MTDADRSFLFKNINFFTSSSCIKYLKDKAGEEKSKKIMEEKRKKITGTQSIREK